MRNQRSQDRTLITFAKGRRGKTSILDCLLTVLSRRNSQGNWPEYTFDQLREQVSILRSIQVPEPSLRSVVYRADLFERASRNAGRVKWKLNSKGRQIALSAASGRL